MNEGERRSANRTHSSTPPVVLGTVLNIGDPMIVETQHSTSFSVSISLEFSIYFRMVVCILSTISADVNKELGVSFPVHLQTYKGTKEMERGFAFPSFENSALFCITKSSRQLNTPPFCHRPKPRRLTQSA